MALIALASSAMSGELSEPESPAFEEYQSDPPAQRTVQETLRLLRDTTGEMGDTAEWVAHALCSSEQLEKCHTVISRAVISLVPRQLGRALNDELFRAVVLDAPSILVDVHTHPYASFAHRFRIGNAEKFPPLMFPRPAELLTGPAGDIDCTNLDEERIQQRPRIRHVSIVVDAGGYWLCSYSEPNNGYDAIKRARMMQARVTLARASQSLTKTHDLVRAIQAFERTAEKIYPGLKVRFVARHVGETEIRAAIRRILH